MDDRMTSNAMRLFNYTPVLFLFNGYWMLSNRQIFENVLNQLESSTNQMTSAHYWSTLFDFTQASPMLLISMVFLIIIILRAFFGDKMRKWGFGISNNIIEVDENLPNFYHALKLSDADWFVKEGNYLRENYNFTFAN